MPPAGSFCGKTPPQPQTASGARVSCHPLIPTHRLPPINKPSALPHPKPAGGALPAACGVLAALALAKTAVGAAAPQALLSSSLGAAAATPLNVAITGAAVAVGWTYAAWLVALRVGRWGMGRRGLGRHRGRLCPPRPAGPPGPAAPRRGAWKGPRSALEPPGPGAARDPPTAAEPPPLHRLTTDAQPARNRPPQPQEAVLRGRLASDTYRRLSLGILGLTAAVAELRVRCAHSGAFEGGPFGSDLALGWVPLRFRRAIGVTRVTCCLGPSAHGLRAGWGRSGALAAQGGGVH